MTITITNSDIELAALHASASACGRLHTSYHPIAYAVERVMPIGTQVVVTNDRVHVYNREAGLDKTAPLNGAARQFHRAWRGQRECPLVIDVAIPS